MSNKQARENGGRQLENVSDKAFKSIRVTNKCQFYKQKWKNLLKAAFEKKKSGRDKSTRKSANGNIKRHKAFQPPFLMGAFKIPFTLSPRLSTSFLYLDQTLSRFKIILEKNDVSVCIQ